MVWLSWWLQPLWLGISVKFRIAAYKGSGPQDWVRVLVDRLWPRGGSKTGAEIDLRSKRCAERRAEKMVRSLPRQMGKNQASLLSAAGRRRAVGDDASGRAGLGKKADAFLRREEPTFQQRQRADLVRRQPHCRNDKNQRTVDVMNLPQTSPGLPETPTIRKSVPPLMNAPRTSALRRPKVLFMHFYPFGNACWGI